MKKSIKLLSFILISFASVSVLANTAASSSKVEVQEEKEIDAKCYVELVGGGETISLWHIKPSLFKGLKSNIVGRKIRVIGEKEKARIYKVKECVLEENKFKNAKARMIDQELGR